MLLHTNSLEETKVIAIALAKGLQKGCFIALQGDLGAGKTAFVQALAKGLGIKSAVTSPTFTLLHQHEGGSFPLYHFDLYRIDQEECYSLGFDEYFYNENIVCAVEWSERLCELPKNAITINIKITGENSRIIEIDALDSKLLKEGWEKIEYTGT